MVVSGPDVGAGHPGGWLGPSQGWISPSPRSGCAGEKHATGRTAPRAALYTLSRRPREARGGVATAFPAFYYLRPGIIMGLKTRP